MMGLEEREGEGESGDVNGRDVIWTSGTAVTVSLSFTLLHPSCPPPPSFFLPLGKLSRGEPKGSGILSILFLPSAAS